MKECVQKYSTLKTSADLGYFWVLLIYKMMSVIYSVMLTGGKVYRGGVKACFQRISSHPTSTLSQWLVGKLMIFLNTNC
jgi:hypothetical protein